MVSATDVAQKLKDLEAQRVVVSQELGQFQIEQNRLTAEANKELDPIAADLRKLKAMRMELKATQDGITEQEKAIVLRKLDPQIETLENDFKEKRGLWEAKIGEPKKQGLEAQKRLHQIQVKVDMWTEIGSVFSVEKAAE